MSVTCAENRWRAAERTVLVQPVVQSGGGDLREYRLASNQREGPEAVGTVPGPDVGATGFEPVTSTV